MRNISANQPSPRKLIQQHLLCYSILSLIAFGWTSSSVKAESFGFRSEGFFSSSDGKEKLLREPWFYAWHLDIDGKNAVTIVSPILGPGYNCLSGDETKVEIDTARRKLVESGTIAKTRTLCRRTITELKGGVLVNIEYGDVPPEIKDVNCRFLFPTDLFKNRRVRWQGKEKGDIRFPEEKPADTTLLNDWKAEASQFRFDLGNGKELGIEFITPTQGRTLGDCRAWKEKNFHLQTNFTGKSMVFFLCLLKPEDPFPEVKLPQTASAPKAEVAVSDKGAALKARKGMYGINIAPSGRITVQKKGDPMFSVEAPYVRDQQGVHFFYEEMKLEKKGNKIGIESKAKDKPWHLRQSFTLEDDGWLSISAKFAGLENAQEGWVELALPTAKFAKTSVLVGDRFVTLPEKPASRAMLYQDWNGSKGGYAFLPADGEEIKLVCDQIGLSQLNDNRQNGKDEFLIRLKAKKDELKFRLNFSKQEGPPAYVKGNLLKEGASFETGADGVSPFSGYSWNEKMADPGVPPVFDNTNAVHGTTSLKLTASDPAKMHSPHKFAFVGAIFNRMPMKRGLKYTVSAWMKADRPGVMANIICAEDSWGGNDWGAFPVSTEWKRYSFSFFTNEFKKLGYYLTWVGIDSQCKEGTLWIDGVQVEEGDLTDFQPSTEVEYGVEVLNDKKLFESGTDCKAVLNVRNNKKTPLDGKVSYVIKDYWEKIVCQGVIPLTMKPESTSSYPLDFGKLPCGYYRGYFTTPTREVEETIFGVYVPQPLKLLPEDWPLACHNDPTPIVRKLGFGDVRAFNVFSFSNNVSKQGKFDFADSERTVKEAEKCGLRVLPILGDLLWPSWAKECPIPAYALGKVTENPTNGRRVAWPKIKEWKDYVRALTSHYKDRIKYWEVMNEPNLWMTPEEYFPYLKASYEAAKEGNPDCQVVGLCATSDFAGKPGTFAGNLFERGATKYFDILSMHLYNTNPPERTLGLGSDVMMENWRREMKDKYGKDASLWHTEKSYIPRKLAYSRRKVNVPNEYCDEPQFYIDDFKTKAEYMLRETLLNAIAGGRSKFFWFGQFYYDSSFITIRYHQPYGLDHTEFDLSPCPELIAANGLARVLDGMSHAFRQLPWGDVNRCTVFTGEKGSMAALWNWKGTSKVVIPVGKNQFILSNFFGEKIKVTPDSKGEIVVDLEGAPKYLSLPGQVGEKACEMLTRARLLDAKTDVIGFLDVKDAEPVLCLKLRNTQISNLSGNAEWSSLPEGWTLATSSLPFSDITPGATKVIQFPLKQISPQVEGATATALVKDGGQQVEKKIWIPPFRSKEELIQTLSPPEKAVACQVKEGDITVDGELGEWSDDETICMAVDNSVKDRSDFDSWQGPADASAFVRLRWTADHLYIGAKIFDDVVMQDKPANGAYACDCLELFLDLDDKDRKSDLTSTEDFLSNADDFQALFAPAGKGRPQPTACWMQINSDGGTKIASKIFPGGYTLEIAVPWTAFKYPFKPAKGKKIGFSLALDDADKNFQRETVLVWKGDTSNYKRPDQWGSLLFK